MSNRSIERISMEDDPGIATLPPPVVRAPARAGAHAPEPPRCHGCGHRHWTGANTLCDAPTTPSPYPYAWRGNRSHRVVEHYDRPVR